MVLKHQKKSISRNFQVAKHPKAGENKQEMEHTVTKK